MAVLYKIRPENRPPPTEPGAAGAHRPDPGREWGRLLEEIAACRRCPLQQHRVVVFRGSLTPEIVFIGEAPGATEERVGLPFVGRAGRILDGALQTLGIGPERYGVLNVLKCRPPRNRFDPSAARACTPFLRRQLDLLGPRRLVSLGAPALRALDPSAPAILEAAGHPRTALGLPLFPMIHPAATFRSGRYADRWAGDLRRLGRWLDGGARPNG
ncbi:MAG: uracil-DNA glycosylase [Thermoplasmata archaeon]